MKFIHRFGAGYNEARHFLSHNFLTEPVWDASGFLEKVDFRLTRRGYLPTWKSFFFRPFDPRLFFGFNSIRIDGQPFIVFFETTLPRVSEKQRMLRKLQLRALLSENCKGAIAISSCARKLQEERIPLGRRIDVLHPPQPILVKEDWVQKFKAGEEFRFCFVGRDFARKGGIEILRAFDKLPFSNWHLTILSDFRIDDYATRYTRAQQTELRVEIYEILTRNETRIIHHSGLANQEVLRIMLESHVGLLPTWHDTYGYSVLEFQASGCPVISTDVRALTEINHEHCGWVLPIGTTFNAVNSRLESAIDRAAFSRTLEEMLRQTLVQILSNDLEALTSLALTAVQRIREMHDPELHKTKVLSIIHSS
jgi:glycosyltransferase involved in cell wall biosynthesis